MATQKQLDNLAKARAARKASKAPESAKPKAAVSGANVIEIRVSQKLTAAQRETFRDALQKLIDSGDLALNV